MQKNTRTIDIGGVDTAENGSSEVVLQSAHTPVGGCAEAQVVAELFPKDPRFTSFDRDVRIAPPYQLVPVVDRRSRTVPSTTPDSHESQAGMRTNLVSMFSNTAAVKKSVYPISTFSAKNASKQQ